MSMKVISKDHTDEQLKEDMADFSLCINGRETNDVAILWWSYHIRQWQ